MNESMQEKRRRGRHVYDESFARDDRYEAGFTISEIGASDYFHPGVNPGLWETVSFFHLNDVDLDDIEFAQEVIDVSIFRKCGRLLSEYNELPSNVKMHYSGRSLSVSVYAPSSGEVLEQTEQVLGGLLQYLKTKQLYEVASSPSHISVSRHFATQLSRLLS